MTIKREARAISVALAALLAGCQGPAAIAPAGDDSVRIRGKVLWDEGDRAALSHPGTAFSDIAKAATVSLVDISVPGQHKTVGSTVSGPGGEFDLGAVRGFVAMADVVYILEAVKGLESNSPRADASRVRTFISFQGGQWTSFTGPAIFISSGTTGLALAYGLREGTATPTGSALSFLGSLVEPGAVFTPGTTGVALAEFATVRSLVQGAVTAHSDPVHVISYSGGAFNLNLTNGPVVNSLFPPGGAVGTAVTISGARFEGTPSDNAVDFNGIPAAVVSGSATQLTVVVPSGATSGPVRVTNLAGAGDSKAFSVVPAMNGNFKIY